MVIEMCQYYYVKHVGYYGSGYMAMKPMCGRGRRASIKCHSERKDCPDYKAGKEERINE